MSACYHDPPRLPPPRGRGASQGRWCDNCVLQQGERRPCRNGAVSYTSVASTTLASHRRPGQVRSTDSSWGLEKWEGDTERRQDPTAQQHGKLFSETPWLCSEGCGEPASIFRERDDMIEAVFPAPLSIHSLLAWKESTN